MGGLSCGFGLWRPGDPRAGGARLREDVRNRGQHWQHISIGQARRHRACWGPWAAVLNAAMQAQGRRRSHSGKGARQACCCCRHRCGCMPRMCGRPAHLTLTCQDAVTRRLADLKSLRRGKQACAALARVSRRRQQRRAAGPPAAPLLSPRPPSPVGLSRCLPCCQEPWQHASDANL